MREKWRDKELNELELRSFFSLASKNNINHPNTKKRHANAKIYTSNKYDASTNKCNTDWDK